MWKSLHFLQHLPRVVVSSVPLMLHARHRGHLPWRPQRAWQGRRPAPAPAHRVVICGNSRFLLRAFMTLLCKIRAWKPTASSASCGASVLGLMIPRESTPAHRAILLFFFFQLGNVAVTVYWQFTPSSTTHVKIHNHSQNPQMPRIRNTTTLIKSHPRPLWLSRSSLRPAHARTPKPETPPMSSWTLVSLGSMC